MATLDSRPRRALDARVRSYQGNVYVSRYLDPLRLDGAAVTIWKACNGQRTVREIAAVVCDEYATTIEEAGRDALSFLEGLADQQLIEWVDEPPEA